MTVSNLIFEACRRNGWTVEELAERLGMMPGKLALALEHRGTISPGRVKQVEQYIITKRRTV